MCMYDNITFTEEHYEETNPCWATTIRVDAGQHYIGNYMSEYETAQRDLTFDLCCSGDYLKVVNAEGTAGVCYRID